MASTLATGSAPPAGLGCTAHDLQAVSVWSYGDTPTAQAPGSINRVGINPHKGNLKVHVQSRIDTRSTSSIKKERDVRTYIHYIHTYVRTYIYIYIYTAEGREERGIVGRREESREGRGKRGS